MLKFELPTNAVPPPALAKMYALGWNDRLAGTS